MEGLITLQKSIRAGIPPGVPPAGERRVTPLEPGATGEDDVVRPEPEPRSPLRERDSATWGEPDVDAAERMVAALGADVVEGAAGAPRRAHA